MSNLDDENGQTIFRRIGVWCIWQSCV